METMGSEEIDSLVLKWVLRMEWSMKEKWNESFKMLMKSSVLSKEPF